MKKRLRKKKHLGEFQELGFQACWIGPAPPNIWSKELSDKHDRFLDRLFDLVDSRGMDCGGGGGCWKGGMYFSRVKRYTSCTDEDREAVRAFLEAEDHIEDVWVEGLTDAWYGPFDGVPPWENSGLGV